MYTSFLQVLNKKNGSQFGFTSSLGKQHKMHEFDMITIRNPEADPGLVEVGFRELSNEGGPF